MHDSQRYLVEEFADEYRHGEISRRDLLRKVLLVTGSTAVTVAALSALGVRYRSAEAAAAPSHFPAATPSLPWIPAQDHGTSPPPQRTDQNVVDPADPSILAGRVTFGGPAGDVFGYLARPADDGSHATVIVVHENRGLIEPNMDIARRYAKEGYVALAVDLVSRAGGTAQFAADLMQATGFLGQANPDDLTADLLAAMSYLADQSFVDAGRLGATGFCFGGGLAWRLAFAATNLRAVVPHYGFNPPLDGAVNMTAAALGIYGELDTRVTGASVDLYTALDASAAVHEKWIEPGASHAFLNNTGTSYNPDAAMDAWRRTLGWFGQYL